MSILFDNKKHRSLKQNIGYILGKFCNICYPARYTKKHRNARFYKLKGRSFRKRRTSLLKISGFRFISAFAQRTLYRTTAIEN